MISVLDFLEMKVTNYVCFLDVLTDSPKWYHKKHVENSEENMHVDIFFFVQVP